MATSEETAAKPTWKDLYKKNVTDPGCEGHHNGNQEPPPCKDIFPMDCPESWKDLSKALQQWGECWEKWGELTFNRLQGSRHCGKCPPLVLPPNPICAICEAMNGLHTQWVAWAERVNEVVDLCTVGSTHIPPPPPPFKSPT